MIFIFKLSNYIYLFTLLLCKLFQIGYDTQVWKKNNKNLFETTLY